MSAGCAAPHCDRTVWGDALFCVECGTGRKTWIGWCKEPGCFRTAASGEDYCLRCLNEPAPASVDRKETEEPQLGLGL